jgi:2,4-dienoyl-CoA reductase-like NADH-dependent reductase (Old Yellow Enzyme family)/thioredoxin reductase
VTRLSHAYPHVFSTIAYGPRTARNRLVRTATTSNLAEKQKVSDRLVAFFRNVARGGVGTVITESVAVHPSYSGGQGTLQLYDPAVLPGLERLVAAVRGEGALFFCQLRHGGRQHHARLHPTLWAPSAIPCPHSGGIPHEMSKAEVREVIDGFVKSAIHCKQAGFDGVEVQGGHGHLIQEFISGFSNQRSDEYGGSYEKRLRFARDILEEVRAAVGRDFVMGYRLGVDEFTESGITLEESIETAKTFAASGLIDFMSLTQGNFNSIETHLPDRNFPVNTFVFTHHAKIKAAVASVSTIPVITTGRIRSPEDAEQILATGKADAIGMCRQLLADPEWPNKAQSGRAAEIRKCTNGNHCWSRIRSGDPIGCELNPVIGREAEWATLTPAKTPKQLVVVGGGPAGLEFSRVAAERGHRVVLMEARAALGGRLAEAATVKGHTEVGDYVAATGASLKRLGVEVKLNTHATADSIAGVKADAVIIAAGATPYVPSVSSDGSLPIVAGVRELPADIPANGHLVLMDEDGDNWAAAETILATGRATRVTLVTRYFEVLRDLPMVNRITTLKRLDELGVQLRPNMEVHQVRNGTVILRHHYSAREEVLADVQGVIWIGRQHVNSQLAAELAGLGKNHVHVIGDAYAPRRLANAIFEGAQLARSI